MAQSIKINLFLASLKNREYFSSAVLTSGDSRRLLSTQGVFFGDYFALSSEDVSLAVFLNSLTASPRPLKNSGIFLPPKSKRIIKAIMIHSVVPIVGMI